jgi:hypothetical protein
MYLSSGGDMHIDSTQEVQIDARDGILVQTMSAQGIHLSSTGGDVTFEASYTVMTGHLEVASEVMATDFSSLSDQRLKTNVSDIREERALSAIRRMRGVTFEWNALAESIPGSSRRRGTKQIGFIAQEVEAVFPQLVSHKRLRGAKNETEGDLGRSLEYKTVSYSRLSPILVQAFKAQQRALVTQASSMREMRHQLELYLESIKRANRALAHAGEVACDERNAALLEMNATSHEESDADATNDTASMPNVKALSDFLSFEIGRLRSAMHAPASAEI